MEMTAIAASIGLEGLGLAAGFVAGLASSAHCAAMCGPLACTASAPIPLTGTRKPPPRWREPVAYHAARVLAYTAAGAALGLAGQGLHRVFAGVMPWLTWVMAAALLASALAAGRSLPLPAAGKRLLAWWMRTAARFSPVLRAGAIGALTPLLPCGMLYGLLLAAAASGSAWRGAGLMAAFALGATPALAVLQAHAPALRRYPRVALWVRRMVPLMAAVVLIWRAWHAGGGAPPRCH